MNPGNYRHGYRPNDGETNPTYQAWQGMKARCLNPNEHNFHRYGGRGIAICWRWLGWSGFINFLADMGDKPEGLTLGRINNNGNYTPKNCRWETHAQQAHNRRSSRLTEADAVAIFKAKPSVKRTAIVRDLVKHYGVNRHSIYKIWDRSNWAEATAGL